MIKNRYTIKKDNDYYYVYMEGIRNRDYRIPMPMKTELEAVILANCLESEYRAGFIDGERNERNK